MVSNMEGPCATTSRRRADAASAGPAPSRTATGTRAEPRTYLPYSTLSAYSVK